MHPWQAYEDFIFSKEEFVNGISIAFSLLVASHSGEIAYFFMFINIILEKVYPFNENRSILTLIHISRKFQACFFVSNLIWVVYYHTYHG